ncbi:hypothetical protein J6590_096498, partial [Homalodisca vitripennis]
MIDLVITFDYDWKIECLVSCSDLSGIVSRNHQVTIDVVYTKTYISLEVKDTNDFQKLVERNLTKFRTINVFNSKKNVSLSVVRLPEPRIIRQDISLSLASPLMYIICWPEHHNCRVPNAAYVCITTSLPAVMNQNAHT